MPLDKYQAAKKKLIDTLAVIDTHVDGESRPEGITNAFDWTELKNSKGVFIKNITLYRPDKFAIILVHGTKGAHAVEHKITDTVEIHCISGKLLMNGLEFKSGDRIRVPGSTSYNFDFLEDTYLTSKFIPKKLSNFINNGQSIDTENLPFAS